MNRTRIVLVRHGESVAMVERYISGHSSCKGLSARGREQAAALADRLARTNEFQHADSLYSSILARAVETAQIIRSGVGDGSLEIDSRCDLCELHMGDEADGITYEQLIERYGEPDPLGPYAPGSETWMSFVERAGAGLRKVAAENEGRTAVIVCHGGVVRASMVAFGNLDDVDMPGRMQTGFFEMLPTETGITVWSRAAGDARWCLERYNDAAHLTAP